MVPQIITLIADPQVLVLPIQDSGEPLVDLYDFPQFFIPAKPDGAKGYFKLRQSVASKLAEAANLLPSGLKFSIIEGHRHLALQKKYFDEYYNQLKTLHPDWTADQIYQETTKFVAPPDIIPPHSTGGAVDLTLVNNQGQELDLGTELNDYIEQRADSCFTLASNISPVAKANRQILIEAMSKVGFVNYPTEWWHWSYGDKYWAYQTNQLYALFGTIGD